MSDKADVSVKFGTDRGEFDAGMEAAAQKFLTETQRMQSEARAFQSAVRDSVASTTSEFSKIGSVLETIQGKFLALTAILAGGKLFKDSIDATKTLNVEALMLGRQLGITATEASILNVALGDIHVTTDTYSHAVTMLGRQLKTNEVGLNAVGIATRDSSGHLLNQQAIMDTAIKRMQDFKEGTDRNQYSMYVFGRGAAEVAPLIKMNADVMEEAAQKAERLGLVVTEDTLAATMQYRKAMHDAKDVTEGFMNAIGSFLMPILTQLGEWFVGVGTPAVEGLRNAFKGLDIVVHAFASVTIDIFAALSAVIQITVRGVQAVSDALYNLVTGNLSRLKKEGVEAWEDMARIGREQAAIIRMNGEEFDKYLTKLLAGANVPTKTKNPGSEDFVIPDKTEKNRVPEWREQLEMRKEEMGNLLKSTLQMEMDYWERTRDGEILSVKERVAINHILYTLKKEQAKQEYDQKAELLTQEMTNERQDLLHKQEIAHQLTALAAATYGAESKEAWKAYREEQKIFQERAVQSRKLADDAAKLAQEHGARMIALERQNMDFQVQLGQITTVQKLAVDRSLLEEDYSQKRSMLEEQLSWTGQLTKEEAAKLNAELSKLDDDHKAAVVKNYQETVLAVKHNLDGLVSGVTNAFDNIAKGLAFGTLTWRKAFTSLTQAILGEFISMGVKMVANWITTHLALTAVEKTQAAIQSGTKVAQTAADIALTKAAAIEEITAYAATAGAAATASAAAIPVYGWAIAPEAGAAAYASSMSYVPLASAAGGWEVPHDTIAKVHEREMILPAKLSDGIRGMIDNGNGQQQGGGDTYHIQALDAKSFERFIRDNGTKVTKMLRGQARNFNTGSTG